MFIIIYKSKSCESNKKKKSLKIGVQHSEISVQAYHIL